MRLVTSEEMRALDNHAINNLGIPGCVLMELAGSAAARAIMERWTVEGRSFIVVCGRGNNGGDGFVVARHLQNHHAHVSIVTLAGESQLAGDALTNYRITRKMNIPVIEMDSSSDIMYLEDLFNDADFIVDAIFGTGLDRDVNGISREVISMINAVSAIRIAIDIPSGLNANTGSPMGICVNADLTVTFGYAKIGHFTSPGFENCGEIVVADISIPPVSHGDATVFVTTDTWVLSSLPRRTRRGHKGNFGHSVIIAGSRGKLGAAIMAGRSAVTMGSGLVTLVSHADVLDILMGRITEEMCRSLCFDPQDPAFDDLMDFISGDMRAVAFGPGLGTTDEVSTLLDRILHTIKGPVIIDADGLTCIARRPEILENATCEVILTPHPGEMARLCGKTVKEIENSRHTTAVEYARKHNVNILLKGARTVIVSSKGRIAINPTGNPGMATGGSGDILTGFITALCAQGCTPFEAMCIGAFLHGRAGDIAARECGEISLKASDIIDNLPDAFSSLGSEDPDE
ncbi:NAD(P)H-hydrate dehydratase [Myxococcota bacterium]|nr:NAD(P)H-hydrate dehydratase [Myxococcota bacterium]MBU1382059.1 NAD(P)H-hydrate dehydratase [Myxococcota bacterium]MBU1495561.1 NAD(P)H-hydrate dehydratase [Myxococcota bacterium]